MEYYLVFPKSNNQLLVRGEAYDYLTFAKFDLKKMLGIILMRFIGATKF